jgi:hypothetical protein
MCAIARTYPTPLRVLAPCHPGAVPCRRPGARGRAGSTWSAVTLPSSAGHGVPAGATAGLDLLIIEILESIAIDDDSGIARFEAINCCSA